MMANQERVCDKHTAFALWLFHEQNERWYQYVLFEHGTVDYK